MSEQQVAAVDSTAAPSTSVQQPAPAPVVNQQSEQEPAWLPDRLKRAEEKARKDMLAELGVADAKDVKAALKAIKDAEDAKKSETEKLNERLKSLEPLESEVTALRGAVAEMAKAALEGLTDRQREAVVDIAGDDPRAQLKAIQSLRSKGMLRADPTAPLPAPANTTRAPGAPAPTSPTTPDHVAAWQELQTRNPIKAAAYRIQHAAAINAAIAARK